MAKEEQIHTVIKVSLNPGPHPKAYTFLYTDDSELFIMRRVKECERTNELNGRNEEKKNEEKEPSMA